MTAIGTCFSHTSLDYVAQINIVHALKCPVILETLWAFVKEHANFFTRGAQFFAEQQELTIGDALATMRASYKQIERRMQDRHTFVPKVSICSMSIYFILFTFRKFSNIQPEYHLTPNALWKAICLNGQPMPSKHGIGDGL